MDRIQKIKNTAYTAWRFLKKESRYIPVEEIKQVNKRSGMLMYKLLCESARIMIAPSIHWSTIENGQKGYSKELKIAVIFGIFMVFVVSFLGYVIFDSLYGIFFIDAFTTALNSFLILLLHLISFVPLIHYGAKYLFKCNYPSERAFRLVSYSILPAILVMMGTGLFPFLEPLNILAYYSFYLLYLGFLSLYKIERETKLHHLILMMAILFGTSMLISIIVSKIISLIAN